MLRTKTELKSGFQGPINLVQGGQGFIIRQPLLSSNGLYWGQVSIVLKADEIYGVISSKADDANIEVMIFEKDDDGNIIYGDTKIRDQNPVSFSFIDEPIIWDVLVIKEGGWISSLKQWSIGVIISFLSAIMITLLVYFFLKYLNIKYRSNHDSLTGLLNRQFLETYEDVVCSTADREASMVGMMIIDIDKFKSVNDTYGHHVGDLVLIEVARIIDKCSRSNESVFRIGGDEFLIVIPKANDQKELEKLKARLLDTYNSEFKIPEHDLFVSISVGIVCDRCIGNSFSELIKEADEKMYEMKDEN
ncbi:MAG: sensor domain-containing diguanylate cyclase [Clostridiales bacterium]|nr:sensor domain-containing diguanylate cyclase [Clostridiales bacterium]